MWKIAAGMALNLSYNELRIGEELYFGRFPMKDERESIEERLIFGFIVGGVVRHEVTKTGETCLWGIFVEIWGEKNNTGAGPIRTVLLTVFRSSAIGFDNVEIRACRCGTRRDGRGERR